VQELRIVQDAHATVLAQQLSKDGDGLLETMHQAIVTGYCTALCGVFKAKSEHQLLEVHKKTDPEHDHVEKARAAVLDVQNRLRRLAE